MILKSPHSDWRLPIANPLDVRAIGLDQLLVRLWLRVRYDNRKWTRQAASFRRVQELAVEMERNQEGFPSFSQHPGVAEALLRADLVKLLKRRPDEFTVARPVHLAATRIRNPKEEDDSYGSAVVYGWMVTHSPALLDELKDFIHADVADPDLDLPSLAIALLAQDMPEDLAGDPEEVVRPICLKQAAAFCEDLRHLLAYRRVMPRSSLVEHLRTLVGFHVGLNLLRTFRIVNAVAEGRGDRPCVCSSGELPEACSFGIELFADCGEEPRSDVARLAEASWSSHEDDLARYVRNHLAMKKLQEFAKSPAAARASRRLDPDSLEGLVDVEQSARKADFEAYFRERIDSLKRAADTDSIARIDELDQFNQRLGLTPFRSYVAILTNLSEKRWVSYHRFLIDSVFLKNLPGGLLRQPLGGRRRRRAVISPGLLETLTLAAVVRDTSRGPDTHPITLDQLLTEIERRYGLLVGRIPRQQFDVSLGGLGEENLSRFKRRLREIGLYVDMSDAYLAQRVTPRFVLT